MSKAADMAKVSAKGGFHLLWGLVLSTVISSVGTIFIARLLGSDLYGLYAIILTAPNLISIFRDWGINSAMVRCTAQYKVEDRACEVRSIFVSGITFEVATGLTLSLISLLLSNFLASNMFNRPEIGPLIQIASITILAGGLINAASAAFIGIERMELNSIMLICQAIIKTLLVIALVILGLGTSGAVIGFTVASVISGLIGLMLIWVLYRHLPKPATIKLEMKAYTQEMLKYGIPLSLSAILAGFLAQFYVFLLPIHYTADNITIGNYGIALNFSVLISFFATPITTMLFPAFSKLDPQKDHETLKNVFQFSIKYAALLVVPVAALIMAVSKPAVSTLFGDTYQIAPLFLALLAISYLYVALGSLSTGNLIISQGKTTLSLKFALLTVAIGFPMGYILIMQFGAIGLIVSSLISGLPSFFISLAWVKKHYKVTVDWRSSAKILLSSGLASALTYLFIEQLSFASWVELILGVGVFILVFGSASLLTRAIDRSDIYSLQTMTSGLGLIGKILNRLLNVLEKIMSTLKL
ncbi:oligosaccharide flippase family protein [Candidatus Bathyarchaeota archaeon]|nr:oligosaccharide flippase family protein [Candidatus Bathyarchaeota archaeon]